MGRNPYNDTYMARSPNSLYRTPSQSPGDTRPRPQPRAKTYEAVSSWQRREMVDISRVLAAGVTNIDTALIEAGEFSIGNSWHVKYSGANKAWGTRRDAWFNQVYAKDCCSRGRMYDWRSVLRAINWTRKVEADYGIIFDGQARTDSTGQRFDPTGRFSVIKYDRISTGLIGGWQGVSIVSVGNGLDECKELPRTWNYFSGASGWSSWPGLYVINDRSSLFDGERIIDGIIIDANMNVLGYRLVGFNPAGLPVYCDIDRRQMHFNFSARKQVDLIRGIPELAEAIMPNMHLDDIQYLVQMAIKLASALAITRKSVDGAPSRGGRANFDEWEGPVTDNNGLPLTDASGAPLVRREKRRVEEVFPGIFELAASNKEELQALAFNRPSLNEEEFVKRVEKSCLHKLWPRDLIYAEDTGRGGMRATAVQANTICTWDQGCVERDARFIADRATEFAMRMGFIPYNDNLADPYEYKFTVPGKFTVDEGNDSKMRLQSLGRCTISRGMICELDGYLAEEIEDQRYEEIDRLMTMSEQLAVKHVDFSVKEIYLMLDSGGQMISFADNAMQEADEEGETQNEETGGGGKPKAEPGKKPGKVDNKGTK